MTTNQRIAMIGEVEDGRTILERLRDAAPIGTAVWNSLNRAVDECNHALRELRQ